MKILKYVAWAALFISFSADVFANDGYMYLGLDMFHRASEFKEGHGKGLFDTRAPNYHLFAGIRANEYFSFELGHQLSPTGMKIRTIRQHSTVLSSDSKLKYPQHHFMRSSLRGLTAGVIWHLRAPWFERRVEGLLYTGMSVIRCKYKDSIIADSSGIMDLSKNSVRTFSYLTGIPRLGVGVNIFHGNFVLRAMTGMDMTGLFKVKMPYQMRQKTVFMKDSIWIGAGIYLRYP